MHKGKEYLEELLDEVDPGRASSIRDYVAELEKASLTDPLTGLWNRNYLEKELPKYEEQYNRNGIPFSYCLIDIKDFFVYNDKHGMEKGDEVLKTLGKTIKENIRANDTGVRIGGDEFVILLSNARGKESLHTIERIKEEMRSHDIYLHAGVADYHTLVKKEPSISYEDIHNYADDALRHSKHTGKTQNKANLGVMGYLNGLASIYKKRNLRARASH